MVIVPYSPGMFTMPAARVSVPAGFPSPAADHATKRIDVLEKIIKHPQATFAVRVGGQSMVNEGIDDGDVLIVDRAIVPRTGHIVMAVVDEEFTVKKFWQRNGRVKLKSGNPTYPDIVPKDGQTVTVWGVTLACIKIFPV